MMGSTTMVRGLRRATDPTGGVAYWAHVGGFVAGLVLVWIFRRRGGTAY